MKIQRWQNCFLYQKGKKAAQCLLKYALLRKHDTLLKFSRKILKQKTHFVY